MRRLRMCILALITVLIGGCGSATEVGNPTGQVPTTRTIKGVIDVATIDLSINVYAATIDPTTLSVLATATDETTVDAPVEADNSFTMDIDVGKSYAMEVLQNDAVVGNFSFEQNNEGTRANRIRFDLPGDEVNLGDVRLRERTFRPEREPRFREGFAPDSEPPPPSGFYHDEFEYEYPSPDSYEGTDRPVDESGNWL